MPGDEGLVIVPPTPGRLLRPEGRRTAGRERDDLDQLIDDLLPDSAEGPGVVDASLVAAGGGLLGWTLFGNPPPVLTVVGVVAVGLGCILPLRAVWRRLADARLAHRRGALLAAGTPVETSDPVVARLVAAYEELDRMDVTPHAARAAAHGALLEVGSLLQGRAPASDKELRYVDARAEAVEELLAVLGQLQSASAIAAEEPSVLEPDLVVEAREELDAIGGVSWLSRLDNVTTEVRSRARGR